MPGALLRYRLWLLGTIVVAVAAIMLFTGLPYARLGFAEAQTIYGFSDENGGCGSVTPSGANGFPIINVFGCELDDSSITPPLWNTITADGAVCEDWLVYHTNQTGDWELFRLGDLPDANEDADANLSRGIGTRVIDIAPTLSPDRNWIAFTSNRDGNWEIYVSAVEEDLQQRVTFNQFAIDRNPVWSPDGRYIIYESNRNANWDLYLFDVTQGTERPLTTSAGNDVAPAWSPDSQTLIYTTDAAGFWQIMELDLTDTEAELVSDGLGDDHEPQYSPDGTKISFRSYRDGANSVIYVMNADGTALERVSDPNGNARNHVWSPDGSLLAYQSNLDGDDDLYLFEESTAQTRQLTDNQINDYAPTWFCDSTSLVFTSDITTDANLFEIPALPIDGPALDVADSTQLTFDLAADQYPEQTPQDENASQQGGFPSPEKNK